MQGGGALACFVLYDYDLIHPILCDTPSLQSAKNTQTSPDLFTSVGTVGRDVNKSKLQNG